RIFRRRDHRSGVLESLIREPERPGVAAHVGRIAGDDAVEFVGITVGLKQSFAASAGAAVPVGIAGIAPVEGPEENFGFDGCFVLGAVGVVDEFFGMAHDEFAAAARGVAVVGGAGGVSALERLGHLIVGEVTTPAAAAHGHVFAVPAGEREPYLGVDI